MKKINILLTIAIFFLALFIRSRDYTFHAPFDWDQNRDYSQVVNITSGDIVILGPVAKGVGGFYLGSLYYYLLVPAFLFMSGSLAALPLTSIIFDSLACALLFLLLHRFTGRKLALAAALLWTFSWYAVAASVVSWNVSLVPLWSVIVIYLSLALMSNPNKKLLYWLAFVGGLSTHIHVATIPVVPLLIALLFLRKFRITDFIVSGLLFLVPSIPLIHYDLTHSFPNLHLFLFQLKSQASAKVDLIPMLNMTIIKLGKVVAGTIYAKYATSFVVGLATLLASLYYMRDSRPYAKLSALLILIAVVQVLLLHDYHFPEYYFGPAYLSIIMLFILLAHDLVRMLRLSKLQVFTILIIVLSANNYSAVKSSSPGGYSLGVKESIVSSLKELPQPIDLTYQLNPGREGGFDYLVDLAGISRDPRSIHRVVISDKLSSPIYVDGELAEDQFQQGDLKTSMYIVQ